MSKIFVTIVIFLAATADVVAETRVTTYVVKVQEERETTRWTLTEWLRIKERMKLMDLWRDLFVDPKSAEQGFRPELNLVYATMQGAIDVTAPGDVATKADATSTQMKAQLWFTNLISGTFGVRTLNVDFGLEVADKKIDEAEEEGTTTFAKYGARTRQGSGNFRIFGKNIQDSSLVLKYGKYEVEKPLAFVPGEPDAKAEGLFGGGEMALYLFSWLGVEGNYAKYGNHITVQGSDKLAGTYYDYAAFIEISLLRFFGGRYVSDFTYTGEGGRYQMKEQGVLGGLKLQF